jgi:hypothetical protein
VSQSHLLQRLRGHGLLVPSMKKAASESHGSRKRSSADDENTHASVPQFRILWNIRKLEAEMVTFPPRSGTKGKTGASKKEPRS